MTLDMPILFLPLFQRIKVTSVSIQFFFIYLPLSRSIILGGFHTFSYVCHPYYKALSFHIFSLLSISLSYSPGPLPLPFLPIFRKMETQARGEERKKVQGGEATS